MAALTGTVKLFINRYGCYVHEPGHENVRVNEDLVIAKIGYIIPQITFEVWNVVRS